MGPCDHEGDLCSLGGPFALAAEASSARDTLVQAVLPARGWDRWVGQAGAAGMGAMSPGMGTARLMGVLQEWQGCCKAAMGGARFYKAGTGGARQYGCSEPGMGGANLAWVLRAWQGQRGAGTRTTNLAWEL